MNATEHGQRGAHECRHGGTFWTCPDYWQGVSQNMVAWVLVIGAVLVIERCIVGRKLPALHV